MIVETVWVKQDATMPTTLHVDVKVIRPLFWGLLGSTSEIRSARGSGRKWAYTSIDNEPSVRDVTEGPVVDELFRAWKHWKWLAAS